MEWGGSPDCQHVWTTQAIRDRHGDDGLAGNLEGSRDSQAQTRGDRRSDMCCLCGCWRGELGSESSPDLYVAHLVEVFAGVRRCLRPDGSLWVVIGDSFVSGGRIGHGTRVGYKQQTNRGSNGQNDSTRPPQPPGLREKELIGIPWLFAFAMRRDGWMIRQEIIWCLSGGARVYARTQKGEMPMLIKDMVRLDPATVQLWNGEKWTQVLGWSRTARPEEPLEIELRSGERIGCTPGHQWPTRRGNVRADKLTIGDVISTTTLPEAKSPSRPEALDDDMVGWFVGLYIAEGNIYKGYIHISGHQREEERLRRLQALASAYDATCNLRHDDGLGATINLYGPILQGILRTYISGEGADKKHLTSRAWRRSNRFLRAVLDGYLSGDGHYDAPNDRWRIGFCQNDNWAADLRTLCARLGCFLRLARTNHTMRSRKFPGYRGQIRFNRSAHWNMKEYGEVVAIRPSRARQFWDIGVADEPHLFALASGVLTHNSKPSCMPESVTDRCTRAHETVFMFVRQGRYFYDNEAIREPHMETSWATERRYRVGREEQGPKYAERLELNHAAVRGNMMHPNGRNRRSVWTINPQPFSARDLGITEVDHYAAFPAALVDPMIRSGTSQRGVCAACGAPWRRVVERKKVGQIRPMVKTDGRHPRRETSPSTMDCSDKNTLNWVFETDTVDWLPTCACNAGDPRPATVLDCFAGSGTTLMVADRLGRDAIGVELNPSYVEMALKRVEADRLARDPILRQQAAARAGGWTAPTLFSLEAATGEETP